MMKAEANYLLAGLNVQGLIHLVVGSGSLAAVRCAQSLQCGAHPIVVAPVDAAFPPKLRRDIEAGLIGWEQKPLEDQDLFRLGRRDVDYVVDAVFITQDPEDTQTLQIVSLCKRHRIPVNVIDSPQLCTFSLLSTHSDGPLQIGVTTNGRGCKLASRIRRTVTSSLPPNLGEACHRLGKVRQSLLSSTATTCKDLEDSLDQSSEFNTLITQNGTRGQAMRWLGQVCEYWPLDKLAAITDDDINQVLSPLHPQRTRGDTLASGEEPKAKYGCIILAGSGPGDPHLLTHATYLALKAADVVLADKLVPSGILELVPQSTPVQIARKFPGNAAAAQQEFLVAAIDAARAGKIVVRLKQGDPFVYGRGAEEIDAFRKAGLGEHVTVLPGITSALSAPLLASITPTHRGVADQVLLCTGTSMNGRVQAPPEFVKSRTVIFMMALHRIKDLVHELTAPCSEVLEEQKRRPWPLDLTCAVIERASCPDQRVIRTTLRHVVEAVEMEGSRPPGLLVVGASCEVLKRRDPGVPWVVEEGVNFGGYQAEHHHLLYDRY